MYKNNKLRRLTKAPSVPQPVFVSQNLVEINNQDVNNEDEIASSQDPKDHEIPSSQDENVSQNVLVSQSRFLSQRHHITRLTQEQDIRGKNYFEIALISCKIQITDMGEFEQFQNILKPF